MGTAVRRVYDHRLRELVCESGSLHLADKAGVCRPTAKSWLRRGLREVVMVDLVTKDEVQLRNDVVRLERRVEVLVTLVHLLMLLVRLKSGRLDGERLPEGRDKERVLTAIRRATLVLRLESTLRIPGLSPSRYHAWRQPQRLCQLDDRSSCPNTTPIQLTMAEVSTIHEMVLDDDYRHIPVSGLAILAQRMGRVFASASTWGMLIREQGWRRPKERVHPKSPTEGVRATRANEYWHIDVTVIRLLNGTRVNLQAVIDNFSRRILAWRVTAAREPRQTRELLLEAEGCLPAGPPPPNVMVDAGTENLNEQVDALDSSGIIKRVLAQVEVVYSNSMIEAWWRSLKHQWLFLNKLDTMAAVERLVAFYVKQHNSMIPHSALGRRTPDEMYFGTGAGVGQKLAEAWHRARAARLAANRATSCGSCPAPRAVAEAPRSRVIPREMQLHPPDSRMSS